MQMRCCDILECANCHSLNAARSHSPTTLVVLQNHGGKKTLPCRMGHLSLPSPSPHPAPLPLLPSPLVPLQLLLFFCGISWGLWPWQLKRDGRAHTRHVSSLAAHCEATQDELEQADVGPAAGQPSYLFYRCLQRKTWSCRWLESSSYGPPQQWP